MFEQERMIGRVQRRVAAEPAITACFLSGSFGRRTEDDYSDLDLVLVYRDELGLEHAWSERTSFAASLMPYVPFKSFDAQHIRPYFHVVLFANGSKLDLRYETIASIQPNAWDRQIRILKDTSGWAASFQERSAREPLAQPAISSGELLAIDQRFWVMYWDVLRKLVRGDADSSFEVYLQLLFFTLPPFLAALPHEDPARQVLVAAHFSHDKQVTLPQFAGLLEAYLQARAALVRRFHLQFVPQQAFEAQIQRLIERLV